MSSYCLIWISCNHVHSWTCFFWTSSLWYICSLLWSCLYRLVHYQTYLYKDCTYLIQDCIDQFSFLMSSMKHIFFDTAWRRINRNETCQNRWCMTYMHSFFYETVWHDSARLCSERYTFAFNSVQINNIQCTSIYICTYI